MSHHLLRTPDGRGVATVTLNEPAPHDALDERGVADLAAAWQEPGDDRAVRLVVDLRASDEGREGFGAVPVKPRPSRRP